MLEDQRLYLACSDATRPNNGPSVLLGILKVGPKRLFIAKTTGGGIEEMEPCCVLDFYVHETAQRGGWGSLLFNTFLESESRHPARLAYDRPSPKLIAFLAKHHNLRSYARQNNNFVVYDEYWSAEVANFGAVRARNGGRPVTARVGGREGLGAAARKRAEAARRVAAELEQQQKQKSQPGGKMNNFRGMGAPPRPTGSFGYQQQAAATATADSVTRGAPERGHRRLAVDAREPTAVDRREAVLRKARSVQPPATTGGPKPKPKPKLFAARVVGARPRVRSTPVARRTLAAVPRRRRGRRRRRHRALQRRRAAGLECGG